MKKLLVFIISIIFIVSSLSFGDEMAKPLTDEQAAIVHQYGDDYSHSNPTMSLGDQLLNADTGGAVVGAILAETVSEQAAGRLETDTSEPAHISHSVQTELVDDFYERMGVEKTKEYVQQHSLEYDINPEYTPIMDAVMGEDGEFKVLALKYDDKAIDVMEIQEVKDGIQKGQLEAAKEILNEKGIKAEAVELTLRWDKENSKLYTDDGVEVDVNYAIVAYGIKIDENGNIVYLGVNTTASRAVPGPSANWKYGTARERIISSLSNEPKVSASVSDKKYNVGMAIPTDEGISGDVTVDADIKYDIEIREWFCNAGINDVTARVVVTYKYNYSYWDPDKYYCGGPASGDKYCVHNKEKSHRYGGTSYADAIGSASKDYEPFSYNKSKVYYDVPKSEIQGLRKLEMTGSLVYFEKAFNVPDGPGPQTISSPIMSEPSLENQHNSLTGSVEGSGYSSYDSANSAGYAAALAKCDDVYDTFVAAAKASVDDAFTFSSESDVNYDYRGLRVTWQSYSGGSPSVSPMSASGRKTINKTQANGVYTHTGIATFSQGYVATAESNPARVHAPVVCNPKIVVDTSVDYDQLIDPDKFTDAVPSKAMDHQNMQLDSIGEIIIPDNKETNLYPADDDHYKNYGSRLYNSRQGLSVGQDVWGAIKDVKFPDFGVYIQDVNEKDENGKLQKIKRTFYLKQNQWLSEMIVNYNQGKASEDQIGWNDVQRWEANYKDQGPSTVIRFVLPVWTEEKKYGGIETRVVAVNMPDQYSTTMTPEAYAIWNKNAEEEWLNKDHWTANMNSDGTPNEKFYVAKNNNLQLYVFGKIYDLQINNSRDPDWLNKTWSQPYQREYIVSQEFPFGQLGQNRNVAYRYAPKLGYTFSFNFKTKGRKAGRMDISVQPEGFYFVSKDGGAPVLVDLWYSKSVYDAKERYIKIDPNNAKDGAKLTTRITDAFLKVNPQEMTDSGRIYAAEFEAWGNKYGNMGPYHYENPVVIGSLSKISLPHALRLTYNNVAEYKGRYPYDEKNPSATGMALYGREKTEGEIYRDAGQDNLIGSVGRWYCGYTLPASTIAVKLGGDPNKNADVVLKNGYILVRMSIIAKAQDPELTTKTRSTDMNALKGSFTKNYLKYTGPEYLNSADGGEYGLDWDPNSSSNLSTRNQTYVPVLSNRTNQPFEYFEREDFDVFLKDVNKDNTFSKSTRKYRQVTFGKPQFEWLTGEQIKKTKIDNNNAYKYVIKYKLPHPVKTAVEGETLAGAVAVFDADLRATQDYDLSGTH